jgi:hypothetical protein
MKNTEKLLDLPHKECESTCYVNGLEDLLTSKGADYPDYLLSIIGGMAGFAYLRYKSADPPCMVYWGASPKYLIKDLSNIIGFKETVIEGRSFKFTFSRLKGFIDQGSPVVVGALDMYYLHYYSDLYMSHHIPIHYFLVVGYDDEKQLVFVHDCSHKNVQKITYYDFEKSMNVKVPGMSKRNTIRTFTFPEKIPSEFEVAKRGFSYKAERFLHPPVRLFGIPAIRRLADEIFEWDNEKCFEHMVIYATTPPLLPETFENSHGMRFWQADVLNTLGSKYNVSNWNESSILFRRSGEKIIQLCKAALKREKQKVSDILVEIANIEEQAYLMLKDVE